MSGTVYVIQGRDTRRYKIGRTKNLDARLRQLRTGSAEQFDVLAQVHSNDAPGFERELHREYAAHRLHLEWFEMPAERALTLVARVNSERVRATAQLPLFVGSSRHYQPAEIACGAISCDHIDIDQTDIQETLRVLRVLGIMPEAPSCPVIS